MVGVVGVGDEVLAAAAEAAGESEEGAMLVRVPVPEAVVVSHRRRVVGGVVGGVVRLVGPRFFK